MKVLNHHIYEYQKGLRDLVLHTMDATRVDEVISKLESKNIHFIIRMVTEKKMNVFFGAKECIEVIEKFGDRKLNEFTPEQDFILGTMLGYSRLQQCERYLQQKERQQKQYQEQELRVVS